MLNIQIYSNHLEPLYLTPCSLHSQGRVTYIDTQSYLCLIREKLRFCFFLSFSPPSCFSSLTSWLYFSLVKGKGWALSQIQRQGVERMRVEEESDCMVLYLHQ